EGFGAVKLNVHEGVVPVGFAILDLSREVVVDCGGAKEEDDRIVDGVLRLHPSVGYRLDDKLDCSTCLGCKQTGNVDDIFDGFRMQWENSKWINITCAGVFHDPLPVLAGHDELALKCLDVDLEAFLNDLGRFEFVEAKFLIAIPDCLKILAGRKVGEPAC